MKLLGISLKKSLSPNIPILPMFTRVLIPHLAEANPFTPPMNPRLSILLTLVFEKAPEWLSTAPFTFTPPSTTRQLVPTKSLRRAKIGSILRQNRKLKSMTSTLKRPVKVKFVNRGTSTRR